MTKNLHPLQELRTILSAAPLSPIFLAWTKTISPVSLNEKKGVTQTLYVAILKTVLEQKESNMGTADKSRIF